MIIRDVIISVTMITIIIGNSIMITIIIGNIIITIINIVHNNTLGLDRGFSVRNLCGSVDVADMLLIWLLLLLLTLLSNKI
tara:strand:+ start:216 stop:458 length:243 start_codon:yes stop_codon:yes gene_type:complete